MWGDVDNFSYFPYLPVFFLNTLSLLHFVRTFLLMVHHEEKRLNPNRNRHPNLKGGTKVQ